MRINKHDTNGTKPLLGKGELGYDDYTAGGDTGRVYVGTGAENIALAERLESNMMTKAQFNALAEERKANRAGSGFDSFGYTRSNHDGINEGMSTGNTTSGIVANEFYLGNGITDFKPTTQKTNYPLININGNILKLTGTNSISTNVINNILLPTAPTIYPYDTVLTAEQIASGVIKHADASNSGLIVNGKFDTDTSGWEVTNGGAISSVSGKLVVNANGNSYGGCKQTFATIIGKQYTVEFEVSSILNSTDFSFLCRTSSNANLTQFVISSPNRYVINFTATTATSYVIIESRNSTNMIVTIDNIAVYPADAISRSDLVFLESWHEDISEKNFVYPLGNVQYLGGNTDGLTGIANGAFTGFETYSLFGNWQTPSALIGNGYVWSSLTEAQKRAFIANPNNNCYLDGDKVIQVRYRVRVVQGLGDSYISGGLLYYNDISGKVYTNNDWLKPKGKLVNITNDLAAYSINETGYYSKINITFLKSTDYASDYGLLVAIAKVDNAFETQTSYNGRNFAILLCSTHRRNQGMYHPVYNANGTKKASDGNFWYNTSVSFTSISDCFDPAKLLTNSGLIASGVSGRPD